MEEFWKDIRGYEGLYQISSLGRVKSFYKNKILKPRVKENDYLIVSLYKEGKDKKFYIHRLVAEAFIPNPENKEYVNHKDFNKSNNSIGNLEWVTRIENFRHYKYSEKWNTTFERRNKKLVSKTLNKAKDYKEKIIELYKQNHSIDDIAEELRLGRYFVTYILYLFDII